LHWMNVKVGDFVISRSFNKNLVIFNSVIYVFVIITWFIYYMH